MFGRFKDTFNEGAGRVKWFSGILRERMRVEMAVLKLLQSSESLERRKRELICQVGERVFELSDRDMDVYEDHKVRETIDELKKVDAEITEIRRRVSEIGESEE